MSKPSKDRKRFEDMGREELLETKADLERQIREVKAQISTAKQSAAATGNYMDVEDFQSLEHRRSTLNLVMSKVDSQLRKHKGQMRESTSKPMVSEEFMRVAQVVLEPALYQHILQEAKTPQ